MIGSTERVLAALNEAGVRYVIVGGVAVVLHGHLRTTADIDLVVELTTDNALKAVEALADLGYRPRAPVPAQQFAEEEARRDWIEAKGMMVFSMWHPTEPGLEVDLFVDVPFNFEEVYARSLSVPLDTVTAPVIALGDLIEMKRRAGRPQDVLDVEALEALAAEPADG